MKLNLTAVYKGTCVLTLVGALYGCGASPKMPTTSQQNLIDEGLLRTECSIGNVNKSKSHNDYEYDSFSTKGWCILSKDKKSLVHTYVFREKTHRQTYALDDYESIAVERVGPTIFSLMLGETSYQYQFRSKKEYRYRKKNEGDIFVRPSKILVMNLNENNKKLWGDLLQTMSLPMQEAKRRYTEPYPAIYYSPIIIYPKK